MSHGIGDMRYAELAGCQGGEEEGVEEECDGGQWKFLNFEKNLKNLKLFQAIEILRIAVGEENKLYQRLNRDFMFLSIAK